MTMRHLIALAIHVSFCLTAAGSDYFPPPDADGGWRTLTTAEEVRREQEALEALRRLLLELSEQSLRLHQRSATVLEALNRDLQQVKTQLKRMAVARA